MDFEEGGDHSGKPFFGCESSPKFVDAETCRDNWGKGDRDATTEEVVPSYCVLVDAVGDAIVGDKIIGSD